MPQSFQVPPAAPPSLGPQWSTWIVIVAVVFLLAVLAFYLYVH